MQVFVHHLHDLNSLVQPICHKSKHGNAAYMHKVQTRMQHLHGRQDAFVPIRGRPMVMTTNNAHCTVLMHAGHAAAGLKHTMLKQFMAYARISMHWVVAIGT